ncbi:MAG TPA: hypothetical protein VFB21_00370 [Chthonomonadaceae bacterium]|nr:hypothetical protein [Chthonomonadaceae bacterium]
MPLPTPLLLCALLVVPALAAVGVGGALPSGPSAGHDYRADFDRTDAAFNGGKGQSEATNASGKLVWGESYLLIAYVQMYQATHDADYLRRLVAHFDRVLQNRDDTRGLADAYAGKPLAGWGSERYSDGKWHVWIVHTGMLTIGPAQFVRQVKEHKALQEEFGAKAAEYRHRIEESLRDADPYWRDGPNAEEGYYYDPYLKQWVPLNMQNAMGMTLLEMGKATGNRACLDKAARLARFFKHRLRRPESERYDWAYWPLPDKDGPGSEDISHACINVAFAALCAAEQIVFTRQDAARFAQTWLQRVVKPDGTWADNVDGSGKGNTYKPDGASLWLPLCPLLPAEVRAAFYGSIARAFAGKVDTRGVNLLGIASLLRYAPAQAVTAQK